MFGKLFKKHQEAKYVEKVESKEERNIENLQRETKQITNLLFTFMKAQGYNVYEIEKNNDCGMFSFSFGASDLSRRRIEKQELNNLKDFQLFEIGGTEFVFSKTELKKNVALFS